MAHDGFIIAQFSDIHCGDPRFDDSLLTQVIDEVNAADPDLVVVPGDLTASGYPDEFRQARSYLDRLECDNVAILIGNHDARKVGFELFEDIFGDRYSTWDFSFCVDCGSDANQHISVLGLDSSKPDLDDGEIGRHRYGWLRDKLESARGFKVVALHHHLVSIPGTGRERNVVWDAGEVLEILAEYNVDLVLAGHKHVPFVWPVAGVLVVTSGTASTWRTRSFTPPSYNMIHLASDHIDIEIRASRGDQPPTLFSYRRMPAEERRPVGKGDFGPVLERVAPPEVTRGE